MRQLTNLVEEISTTRILQHHIKARNIDSSGLCSGAELIGAKELEHIDVFEKSVNLYFFLQGLPVCWMARGRLRSDGSVRDDFHSCFFARWVVGIDCAKDSAREKVGHEYRTRNTSGSKSHFEKPPPPSKRVSLYPRTTGYRCPLEEAGEPDGSASCDMTIVATVIEGSCRREVMMEGRGRAGPMQAQDQMDTEVEVQVPHPPSTLR